MMLKKLTGLSTKLKPAFAKSTFISTYPLSAKHFQCIKSLTPTTEKRHTKAHSVCFYMHLQRNQTAGWMMRFSPFFTITLISFKDDTRSYPANLFKVSANNIITIIADD